MTVSTRVIVAPASGGRETLAVFALVLMILAGSTSFVALHRRGSDTVTLPQWQVDLRSGLNAAEQGLTADLLNAASEIPSLPDASPPALAAEGFPPFTADATATLRGGHLWELVQVGPLRGWRGTPAAPDLARMMLLRLDAQTPTIWIAQHEPTSIGALTDAALIAAGWQQVVTRYDASVTRKDAP